MALGFFPLPLAGQVWQATAVMAADSTLSADARRFQTASMLLGSAGSFALDATVAHAAWQGSTLLIGAGNLAIASMVMRKSSALLAGASDLAATSRIVLQGRTTLAGAGALAISLSARAVARAQLSAAGALANNSILFRIATSRFAGSGLFVSSAVRQDPPDLHQQHFRIRTDALAVDAAPTWAADVDVNYWSSVADFRLRFSIGNNSFVPCVPSRFKLTVSRNSGVYQPVTTTSLYVKASDVSASADETPIAVPRLP